MSSEKPPLQHDLLVGPLVQVELGAAETVDAGTADVGVAPVTDCQVLETAGLLLQLFGTVKEWFGSASHTTVPSVWKRMYLYWKDVPGGKFTVPLHRGFDSE